MSSYEKDLQEIRRRLAALERSPQLQNSSQDEGEHTLYGPNGEVLFKFGDYIDVDAANRYGAAYYDELGNIILATDNTISGLAWPGDNQQWGSGTATMITSGTYATSPNYSTCIAGLNGDVLIAQGAILTDVGTTGEIRVRYAGWDGSTNILGNTNTVAIPSGANGNWVLKWLHPFEVGRPPTADFESGFTTLFFDVRRTGGAGNVYIYRPRLLWCGSSAIVPSASDTTPLTFV